MNERRQQVRTKVGDVVAIHGHHLGEPERLGEILEILGSAITSIFACAGMIPARASSHPVSDATVRVRRQKREVKKP